MRLLVDAQLPVRLVPLLIELGHDVVHTSELPNGNRTPDREITQIAEVQDRIVVTKDRDFVDGHLLSGAPRRLLLVSTGNIRNDDLIDLFAGNSDALADAFDDVDFVELDRNVLILHG
jgi:predicted nuclease of predicted toxin-antitoxin system